MRRKRYNINLKKNANVIIRAMLKDTFFAF